MKGKIIIVLVTVLFLDLASAISISISPPTINLIGKVDEKVCAQFRISSDKVVYFSIENKKSNFCKFGISFFVYIGRILWTFKLCDFALGHNFCISNLLLYK